MASLQNTTIHSTFLAVTNGAMWKLQYQIKSTRFFFPHTLPFSSSHLMYCTILIPSQHVRSGLVQHVPYIRQTPTLIYWSFKSLHSGNVYSTLDFKSAKMEHSGNPSDPVLVWKLETFCYGVSQKWWCRYIRLFPGLISHGVCFPDLSHSYHVILFLKKINCIRLKDQWTHQV